ncbi:MAG: hypothetical protein JWO56_2362 [Acidobacteria bacterium]|nr:hypothetical protein [Acidobacteriota bacterium]
MKIADLKNYLPPELIALAIFFLVRQRGQGTALLPDLPWAKWWLLLAGVVVFGFLSVQGMRAIGTIDANLVQPDRAHPGGFERSAKLEWVYSPWRAAKIIKHWKEGAWKPGESKFDLALEGLCADTVRFVPFYPLFLFFFTLLASRAFPPGSPWYSWGVALAWGCIAAGLLDLLENGGIWLEMQRDLASIAPITATVALLKWILLFLSFYYLLAAGVAKLLSFVHRS